MKPFGKMLFGVLGGLLFCAGVSGGLANPYQGIVTRNVFGLREPLLPPDRPAQPPPKITLTGITTILGYNLAFLKAQKPGKEQALMLTEGQRDGDVQVLEIDEKAGRVTVNNFGTVMTLTF